MADLIPLYAPRVLTCFAQLFVAESLMEQALVAKNKLAETDQNHPDYLFYKGKIASAQFFTNNILPNVYMQTDLIKTADRTALECPEEAFLTN